MQTPREIPEANRAGIPILELVLGNIQVAGDGCWNWTGKTDRYGYGRISLRDSSFLAHRVSYTAHLGRIPYGLTLDHLCRNTLCVNPNHLEPVTLAVNQQRTRRTHCAKGHSLDDAYVTKKVRATGTTDRQCRQCTKDQVRDYRARKRALAA